MFETLLSKIASIVLTPIMAISGFFAPEPPAVGTSLPEAVAVFETSLAAPITANATTMTLTANSIRGGGSLSGFNCFTIDEGSAQAEFVCGTVATTTVSGLTRGISPADGITEDTDLQFSHRRGANVKITDFPILQRLKLQNNGEGSFENAISYAAGVTPTGNSHLTDVEYVLGVVNGGAVSFDQEIITGTAGETFATGTVIYLSSSDNEWYKADADLAYTFADVIIGIAQSAGTNASAITGGILLSGVDSNQSALTAGSRYFLSSTGGALQTATSSQIIGFAKSTTELILDPSILDTYNGYSTTYAGNNTYTGSTTLATSTFSGLATFNGGISGHASTTVRVYTADDTWTKPNGLEYAQIWTCGGGGGSAGLDAGHSANSGGSGGGGGGCAYELLDATELTSTSSVAVTVGAAGTAGSSGNGGTGGTSRFSSFMSATGGSGGVLSGRQGGAGGVGSGGDLNIVGQAGQSGYNGTAGAGGGAGGSSHFGGGGRGAGNGASQGGEAGQNYGGGGGGPFDSGTAAVGGAAGAIGVVIVIEHL